MRNQTPLAGGGGSKPKLRAKARLTSLAINSTTSRSRSGAAARGARRGSSPAPSGPSGLSFWDKLGKDTSDARKYFVGGAQKIGDIWNQGLGK